MEIEKKVLNVKEVANILGVSVDTIYTMVREQEIPYVRLRRRIVFYMDSLFEWLQAK